MPTETKHFLKLFSAVFSKYVLFLQKLLDWRVAFTHLWNDCVVGLLIWHEHVWILLVKFPQGLSLLVGGDPSVVLLGNVDSLVSG